MSNSEPQFFGDSTEAITKGLTIKKSFYNGSGATLAKGKWVQLDFSVSTHGIGTAIKLAVDADGRNVAGVTAADIEDGKAGEVIVYGPTDGDTSILSSALATAGELLQIHTTDGMATLAGGATETAVVGCLLVDDTDDTGKVFVRCLGQV